MRSVHKPKTRRQRRARRHRRVRKKVGGTADRPRLAVYRSLRHVYAQVVDDDEGRTLVGVSDLSDGLSKEKPGKVGVSFAVGKLVASKAQERGIKRVVFDRAGYPYHGRVRAVAEGARDGGLEF